MAHINESFGKDAKLVRDLGGSPGVAGTSTVMDDGVSQWGLPRLVAAPANASAAGRAGDIAYDATHFYVCIATNSWVRATFAGGF